MSPGSTKSPSCHCMIRRPASHSAPPSRTKITPFNFLPLRHPRSPSPDTWDNEHQFPEKQQQQTDMPAKSGTEALLEWCKRSTEGFKDVNVTNFTTSWRDGLAFCALIARYRPDALDFSKRSKDKVFTSLRQSLLFVPYFALSLGKNQKRWSKT